MARASAARSPARKRAARASASSDSRLIWGAFMPLYKRRAAPMKGAQKRLFGGLRQIAGAERRDGGDIAARLDRRDAHADRQPIGDGVIEAGADLRQRLGLRLARKIGRA